MVAVGAPSRRLPRDGALTALVDRAR